MRICYCKKKGMFGSVSFPFCVCVCVCVCENWKEYVVKHIYVN